MRFCGAVTKSQSVKQIKVGFHTSKWPYKRLLSLYFSDIRFFLIIQSLPVRDVWPSYTKTDQGWRLLRQFPLFWYSPTFPESSWYRSPGNPQKWCILSPMVLSPGNPTADTLCLCMYEIRNRCMLSQVQDFYMSSQKVNGRTIQLGDV